MSATPIASRAGDTGEPDHAHPGPRRPAGWIVAGSLAVGAVAAIVLPLAPFVRPEESEILGAVLCGFALGWALLAVLTARFTDQPQRWAAVPAVFFGLCGLLLVVFGSPIQGLLNWVWPLVLLAMVVWMTVRVHRRLRSRSKYWLLYPLFTILALASIGGGYETVREAVDAGTYPTSGRMIEVDGHDLHLNCTGSGEPTVVLEAGGGGTSALFGWIAPVVAMDTRVCAYDRAGLGWSEPAKTAQDGTQIATDLHTLLQRGGVSGPYVLAGHSFGGLYVRAFAALHPEDVSGLVLIDSTAGAASATASPSDEKDSYRLLDRVAAAASIPAQLGLDRLYAQLDFDTLPPESRDEARASAARGSQLRNTIGEYGQAGASAKEAALLHTFGEKPLIVLTAGSGNQAGWSAKQEAMAALSTNSSHRVVDGATHDDLLTKEKDAAAVTKAIRDVIESIRTGEPLND
jgi:pimeloyl-ACP methyl ester carboxylesterase